MPGEATFRTPAGCRWLLTAAGWFVPRAERHVWQERQHSTLQAWWCLVQRGEILCPTAGQALWEFRGLFHEAFWMRFRRDRIRKWVLGPGFIPAVAAVILSVAALCSGGFSFTASLFRAVGDPSLMPPDPALGSTGQEMLVLHSFLLLFALVVGIALVASRKRFLEGSGWRYWSFFALKAVCVVVLVPLLWMEAGAAIRYRMTPHSQAVVLAGLVSALVFVSGFALALLWAVADQRGRCPVCLRHMGFSLTVGSWASLFDPATTELVCEQGHGAVRVHEAAPDEPDSWTPLDESWRDLFATHSG